MGKQNVVYSAGVYTACAAVWIESNLVEVHAYPSDVCTNSRQLVSELHDALKQRGPRTLQGSEGAEGTDL